MFYVRADLSDGSYSITRDLGSNAQRDYDVAVDVQELSSTSYLAQAFVRETETDAWQLLNGAGSEAVETALIMRLQGTFRYVKVDVTTSGGTFESGVVGY